jgi:hypothetical protein
MKSIENTANADAVLRGIDEFVWKLPRGLNPALHTIAPTAAFRARHPETRHGPAA